MMKRLTFFVVALITMLSGCRKYDRAIDRINDRLDKIENTQIKSVQSQIEAINLSIPQLKQTDKVLNEFIVALETSVGNLQTSVNDIALKVEGVRKGVDGQSETIELLDEVLKELRGQVVVINGSLQILMDNDSSLSDQISDLQKHVDILSEGKASVEWLSATFASLEHHKILVADIAVAKTQIETLTDNLGALEGRINDKITKDIASAVSILNSDIQQKVKDITDAYTSAVNAVEEDITSAYTESLQAAISECETSLKQWVNEQFTGYYTIAEIDSKLIVLQNAATAGDEELLEEIATLSKVVDALESDVTQAYNRAIEDAIVKNNGVIDAEIADEISTLTYKVDLELKMIREDTDKLRERVNSFELDIEALISRIQSVSYVPKYSDGKATVMHYGSAIGSYVEMDFVISPKSAVNDIVRDYDDVLSLKAVNTMTRAVEFIDMPIVACIADAASGVVTITASGENLQDSFFSANSAASAALFISDGKSNVISEYVPLVAEKTVELTDNVLTAIYRVDSCNEKVYLYGNAKGICGADNPIVNIDYGDGTYGTEETHIYNVGEYTVKYYLEKPITEIAYRAFCSNRNIYSIIIPKTVRTIGGWAFSAITLKNSLVNVTFEEGSILEVIEEGAFAASCIESIRIPSTVTEIGGFTFSDCSNLKEIRGTGNPNFGFYANGIMTKVLSNGKEAVVAFSAGRTDISEVVIGPQIEEIYDGAFSFCPNMKTLNLQYARNLKTIGQLCMNCPNLESIVGLENTALETIANNSFSSCPKLKSITIPANIKKLEGCFYNDDALTDVTIPEGVMSIDNGTFSNCPNLNTIIFNTDSKLEKIGDRVFSGCSSLISVTIPASVKEIGIGAFCDCKTLEVVEFEIGSELKKIQGQDYTSYEPYAAFAECPVLKSFDASGCSKLEYMHWLTFNKSTLDILKIGAEAPPVLDYPLSIPAETHIYVPSGVVESYKSAIGWSDYSSNIAGY